MIEITYDLLDPHEMTTKIRSEFDGAVVTFIGTTRRTTNDREVLRLEYEAYRPMADNKLLEIDQEIRQRWSVNELVIAHRLGRLEILDVSLVVVVASPHRKEAFAACQHSVDRIKQIVPIWKKEFFKDGEIWVGSQKHMDWIEQVKTPTS